MKFFSVDYKIYLLKVTLYLKYYLIVYLMWDQIRYQKYIYYENFRPQLFDLNEDPAELIDLGESAPHGVIRAEMHERLFAWIRKRRLRTTMSDDQVASVTGTGKKRGYFIGVW